VTNQEVISLIQPLKAGRKPDIAIFCNGVNESLVGGFSAGESNRTLELCDDQNTS
jgi:hypothetical protein